MFRARRKLFAQHGNARPANDTTLISGELILIGCAT